MTRQKSRHGFPLDLLHPRGRGLHATRGWGLWHPMGLPLAQKGMGTQLLPPPGPVTPGQSRLCTDQGARYQLPAHKVPALLLASDTSSGRLGYLITAWQGGYQPGWLGTSFSAWFGWMSGGCLECSALPGHPFPPPPAGAQALPGACVCSHCPTCAAGFFRSGSGVCAVKTPPVGLTTM